MSDVPWNDPKFGVDDNLSEEDRLKLERALQRQAEEAHRRAPGRSQADLHEYGTVSEGVDYGRPVPPTAREDWHAQQRAQALAEQQDPIAQPVAEPSYSDVSEARARSAQRQAEYEEARARSPQRDRERQEALRQMAGGGAGLAPPWRR